MFILVDAYTDSLGKVMSLEILDTDDLVVETITPKELYELFVDVPNLTIKGVNYFPESKRLGYNVSGGSYHEVSDNYGVITRRVNGGRGDTYFRVSVYKKGVSEPIYGYKTPEKPYDYLNFDFTDLDNKCFVIDISVTDKHYYGEDREEYLSLIVIIDTSVSPVKEVRKDPDYVISGYASYWSYNNGELVPYN